MERWTPTRSLRQKWKAQSATTSTTCLDAGRRKERIWVIYAFIKAHIDFFGLCIAVLSREKTFQSCSGMCTRGTWWGPGLDFSLWVCGENPILPLFVSHVLSMHLTLAYFQLKHTNLTYTLTFQEWQTRKTSFQIQGPNEQQMELSLLRKQGPRSQPGLQSLFLNKSGCIHWQVSQSNLIYHK